MDEEKVAERLRNGDQKALEEVTRKYTPLVSTIIANISAGCFSVQDIEETTSDTFIALWYNRDKIQTDKLKGFICCIAKNKAKNKIKSSQRHQNIVNIEGMEFEDTLNVSQKIEYQFISNALKDALDKIGEPDREIIIRHYYYYQSSTVISEKMQMNSETVKSRIKRAKDKLKKILSERGWTK